jgi:hypothetical protein
MKLLAPFALLLSLASANSPRSINIATFEEHFINSLAARSPSESSNTSTIALVGYMSIPIEPEYVADFEKDYFANVSL